MTFSIETTSSLLIELALEYITIKQYLYSSGSNGDNQFLPLVVKLSRRLFVP